MKSKYVRLRTPHLFTITYYLFTAAKGSLSGRSLIARVFRFRRNFPVGLTQ